MNRLFFSFFKNFGIQILNTFFPECCCECKKMLIKKEIYICKKCLLKKDLFWDNLSDEKIETDYIYKKVHLFNYKSTIQEMILKAKRDNQKKIFSYLISFINYNELLLNLLASFNFEIITAVPVHSSNKVERGFNQSEIISIYLSKLFNIPYSRKILFKIKKTKSQKSLTKEERMINVKNVFKSSNIYYKKILLIDDVYTTGSTVNECSKELIRAGAKRVYIFTLAKTLSID